MEKIGESIAKAIIKVMEEVGGVAKNMTVGSGNNSYKGVSDKDVRLKLRESMYKNGLSILPIGGKPKIQIDRWEEESEWNGKTQVKTKQSIFTEIETEYILLHESGENIKLYGYGQGVDTQDKGAGKATTYALKNTLLNMFLIPTGVDTDDTHSDDLPTPQKNKKDKALGSEDLTCPSCGVVNEESIVKHGTTKTGTPYHLAKCSCGTDYFIKDNFFGDKTNYAEKPSWDNK